MLDVLTALKPSAHAMRGVVALVCASVVESVPDVRAKAVQMVSLEKIVSRCQQPLLSHHHLGPMLEVTPLSSADTISIMLASFFHIGLAGCKNHVPLSHLPSCRALFHH